ncbi:MAG: ribonuclease H-like domain-containing protein [Calditrichia bacterium]
MNIRDKLSRLDKTVYQPVEDENNTAESGWKESFRQELDAEIHSGGSSFIAVKENYYPVYKNTAFRGVQENGFILEHISRISGDLPADPFHLRETIFIDTETTGLAGGAGTVAFLIGIGHIELDHIVVRQYLLPDYQHEWLLLQKLENVLLGCRNVVSFNGKSYDIPLLRNRFILNRMDSCLDEKYHLDLLHPARRLWRRRLTACDLQSLEKAILGQERVGDVAGELIPQIYFEYIRKRDALLLRDILEHNFYDIVNLALLTMQIGRITEDPVNHLSHPQDIYSLASWYYNCRFYQEAVDLLQAAGSKHAALSRNGDFLFLLSMALKKLERFAEATEQVKQLLQQKNDHPQAVEELAKYYEHKEKDYPAALELVEQSLNFIEMLDQMDHPSPLREKRQELLHRRNRLMKRIERQAAAAKAVQK